MHRRFQPLRTSDMYASPSPYMGTAIMPALLLAVCVSPVMATGDYTGPGFTWKNAFYNGTLETMGSSSIIVPAGEPDGETVVAISVELDGWHTWVGDMTIKLAGPAGLMMLVSRPGLNEPADDGTWCCGSSTDWVLGSPQTFVDGAGILAEDMGLAGTPSIPAQLLQPSGVYDGQQTPPTSLMQTFGGTSAAGEWTLYIGSSQGGDIGKVDTWTLHLTTTGGETIPTVSHWGFLAMAILGLIAGTLILGRRVTP